MKPNHTIHSSCALTQAACKVLDREIEGLQRLYSFLDNSFIEAVELIHASQGRLILTGMGKSGHIAGKIAATIASTGTPAFFVHPSEASHGDLGMITKDDMIIALSNSGETTELKDMLAYATRFSIPVIAIVRRRDSTLVRAATIAFVLPDVEEASPIGAPTTSAIMMLAFGDALAMALLEKKGFTRDDFKSLHPGGKLGAALLKVIDIAHTGEALPLVTSTALLSEVLLVMTSKGFGCAAVVDEAKKIIGVITDGDLRRHMSSHLLQMSAVEVMTPSPRQIHEQMFASKALGIMNEQKITSLFIYDNHEKVSGIIHIHDLLRAGVV